MDSVEFLEVAASLTVQVALMVVASGWLSRLAESSRTRCRIWTACYVTILLLVAAGAMLPHMRLVRPWSRVDEKAAVALATIGGQVGGVLLAAWLLGVLFSLAVFCYRTIRASVFLKHCRPAAPELLSAEIFSGDLARLIEGPRGVRILSSERLSTPFCWQFHRPFIVLPEYLLTCNRTDLFYIVRHEIEHLRAGHPLQLFLQHVVEIIFWFHPLIWWASRESSLAREFACDEAAVESRSDVAAYLRVLLNIVENAAGRSADAPAPLAFGREPSTVVRRARRLVDIARRGTTYRHRTLSTATAVSSILICGCLAGMFWLPMNALASPRAVWSPWPVWSSRLLYDLGLPARDFEVYDRRTSLYELLQGDHARPAHSSPSTRLPRD